MSYTVGIDKESLKYNWWPDWQNEVVDVEKYFTNIRPAIGSENYLIDFIVSVGRLNKRHDFIHSLLDIEMEKYTKAYAKVFLNA